MRPGQEIHLRSHAITGIRVAMRCLAVPMLVFSTLATRCEEGSAFDKRLNAALASGRLVWRLSEQVEVREALGAPVNEEQHPDGGMEVLSWTYGPSALLLFFREAGGTSPFVLARGQINGTWMGPGNDEILVLRDAQDLRKLRPFMGLQAVDASHTDLRGEGERLKNFPFNTRTIWPAKDRLPDGFDPSLLMEMGRNPGLGLRTLHSQGLDGRGVDIGIIDQPLIKDHPEVAGRLEIVAELEVGGFPPQMHGPGVTSLAAGRTCGVAPGATVRYVSMAMWKSNLGNQLYIRGLERLLELNRAKRANIRVVSISYGGFQKESDAEAWKALLAKAEAQGVLVITCDVKAGKLDYGLLTPLPGGDRDKPEGYTRGLYGRSDLLVPGDGRTYAHHVGQAAFTYGPHGGLSWGAPWIAGLAALGFQVNPDLTPAQVRAYLLQSTTRMPYGKVANPVGFIRLCRNASKRQIEQKGN